MHNGVQMVRAGPGSNPAPRQPLRNDRAHFLIRNLWIGRLNNFNDKEAKNVWIGRQKKSKYGEVKNK